MKKTKRILKIEEEFKYINLEFLYKQKQGNQTHYLIYFKFNEENTFNLSDFTLELKQQVKSRDVISSIFKELKRCL